MARTIKAIQAEIILAKENDAILSALDSTSKVAIWRLWTFIVASAIWTLEVLFDAHKSNVQDLIEAQKPHTLRWYQQKALSFQYGSDLVAGEDYFDNSLLDADQVAAQLVIAEAAAVENNFLLTIKVSGETNGELAPVSNDIYDALVYYFSEIKDAGVKLSVINNDPDKMTIKMDVYYNPLVLTSDGNRIDGASDTPVQDAINNYLRNLQFNGEMVLSHLIDYCQAVEGVEIPHVVECLCAKFDNPAFINVTVRYEPYAGTLRIYNDTDIELNFIKV